MSDNKDIQIPSFMNNTSKNSNHSSRRKLSKESADIIEYDFKNAREKSCDAEPIHAKKTRKKITKMSDFKKMSIAFGLGVGVTLGVVGFVNKDNNVGISQKFENWQITNKYLSDLYSVVSSNAHTGSGGVTWYDVVDISGKFEDMLEQGVPEEAIAYVTANSFDYTYETDERSYVFNSLFDASPDEWAKQHGYDSIEDKNFEKDVKRDILRSAKIDEYNQSLNSMLEDTGNKIDSNAKGMGGK